MGKLYFLLAERISSSSIGSFGSSGYSFSSHLYMLDLFHSQSCTLFACIHSGEWFCLLSYKNISWSGQAWIWLDLRAIVTSWQPANTPGCRLKQYHLSEEPKCSEHGKKILMQLNFKELINL